MILSPVNLSAVICALSCSVILRSRAKRRNRLPLPPGPTPLPLIGNMLDMPDKEEWEAARKWGEKYGPVVYIEILGTPYVFLNTYEAAVDLLEKRGANYSTRPSHAMLDMQGWTETFPVVMPYGDELKESRQMLHRFLQPAAVGDYTDLQTRSTHKVLEGLLRMPDRYFELIRHSAGEIIMMATYGYQVAEQNDLFVELGEKALSAFAEAEGFFLVNVFPVLKYLPAWFPGAGFQKIAKQGYEYAMAVFQKPHELVKQRMRDGVAIPSMSSRLIESHTRNDGSIDDEALIAKTTGVTFGGGADTTVSAMLTFLLAMVLYPNVQKRAQEELNRVVGKNNLPSFEDKPNLPYIEAIGKECLRWQPIGPFGVVHASVVADEYSGYHIPGSATVLPNIWAMSRDTNIYENPNEFLPERWFPRDGKEPPLDSHKIAFGFGRRICPGRHFADNSIFIGIASVLSAFEISKALDAKGEPITPKVDYVSHFIRHPKPFKYSIKPRSPEVVKAIHQAVDSTTPSIN